MPYLKIQTNQEISTAAEKQFLKKASTLVATHLGKPERYVMVRLDPVRPMIFAGTTEPCVYMELKSIGLPESRTAALSKMLCQFIRDEWKIPADRIYIEFADARDAMWGWNGGTFA